MEFNGGCFEFSVFCGLDGGEVIVRLGNCRYLFYIFGGRLLLFFNLLINLGNNKNLAVFSGMGFNTSYKCFYIFFVVGLRFKYFFV